MGNPREVLHDDWITVVLANVKDHPSDLWIHLVPVDPAMVWADKSHDSDDIPVDIEDWQLGCDVPILGAASRVEGLHAVHQRAPRAHHLQVILADCFRHIGRMNRRVVYPQQLFLGLGADAPQSPRADRDEASFRVLGEEIDSRKVLEQLPELLHETHLPEEGSLEFTWRNHFLRNGRINLVRGGRTLGVGSHGATFLHRSFRAKSDPLLVDFGHRFPQAGTESHLHADPQCLRTTYTTLRDH